MYSYSARIVTEWLDAHGLSWRCKSNGCLGFVETGVALKLTDAADQNFELSVQTDPTIAGRCFAETAMTRNGQVVLTQVGNYGDVRGFRTPEELFDHLSTLTEEVAKTTVQAEESLGQEFPLDYNSE